MGQIVNNHVRPTTMESGVVSNATVRTTLLAILLKDAVSNEDMKKVIWNIPLCFNI